MVPGTWESGKAEHVKKVTTSAIFGNTRGLFPKSNQTKVSYYENLAKMNNSIFICLTESHLTESIADAEIKIEGQKIYRTDRKQRMGGGVITYLRDDLAVSSELKHSNSFCDTLGLHIPELELALVTIYRPPKCPQFKFKEALESVTEWITGLETQGKPTPTILISGDFNLGFLNNWNNEHIESTKNAIEKQTNVGKAVAEEKTQAKMLIEFVEEHFLMQQINEGTRKDRILDLVFTNDENLVLRCSQIQHAKLSDHNTTVATLSYNLKPLEIKEKENFATTVIPKYDTAGADEEDWLRANELLKSIDWQTEFEGKSETEMTNKLLYEMEQAVIKTMKKKHETQDEETGEYTENVNNVKKTFKSTNRIPRQIRTQMKRKQEASDGLKTVKSVRKCLKLREKLENAEEELKKMAKSREMKMEESTYAKIKRNPKAFFSYAKKKQKTFSGIGPFLKENGDPVEEHEAESLRKAYEKAFSKPKEEAIIKDPNEFFKDTPNEVKIEYIPVDEIEIRMAIDELSPNAAPGPDGVPARLLKKCKETISEPLCIIWSQSLRTGNIPDIFKTAHITPILKPGNPKAKPESYRPVSLTSHLVKIFERIVKKYLQNHLECHMKISEAQHGFRQKRSCLSQLLEHYEYILKGLEQGLNVETIYLDFCKAFDKVDKGILCQRMKEKGIHGNLGVWLHNFLTNRTQCVIANNQKSFPTKVTSGVPQGTVLGPLLFLLLIDSITDCEINAAIRLFADDTRITKHVKTESDMEELQDDLQNIYDWQQENNMLFNGNKFEMLRYGKNEDLKNSCNYLTPNFEDIIERKEVVKDLGIKMNDDANFKDHINFVCSKVKQRAGWVLRTFRKRDSKFMKFMWKTYMQGHIDYCSQLWQPLQSGMLQQIENLQKSFTKKIPQIANMNYWERLTFLKINSQQRRLERYRIIYIWKILEGLSPNCGIVSDENELRGRMCKLPKICKTASEAIKSQREQTLQVHGCKLFNKMPAEIRNVKKCSVEDFKFKLDNFLATIPDQPVVNHMVPATSNPITLHPSNSILDLAPLLGRDLRRNIVQ